jgi:uncharacterized protein
MAIDMHSASVPMMRLMLQNMLAWLDKAEAHATARRFKPDNYLGLRLAPDMLPFSRQVQIASDHAKGCVARLAGVENPKYDDSESSLDELRARIRKTLAFIDSIPADKVRGSEAREVVLPMRAGELRYTGEDYLRHFALPNFYFHCTTAYALLRHAGVELGKVDFLGAAPRS